VTGFPSVDLSANAVSGVARAKAGFTTVKMDTRAADGEAGVPSVGLAERDIVTGRELR
jgi:hypothetical protein